MKLTHRGHLYTGVCCLPVLSQWGRKESNLQQPVGHPVYGRGCSPHRDLLLQILRLELAMDTVDLKIGDTLAIRARPLN
jgi:hypothetical protein